MQPKREKAQNVKTSDQPTAVFRFRDSFVVSALLAVDNHSEFGAHPASVRETLTIGAES